ncbi:MAG: cupredoxin domain-containing protein [Thermoplasmata archaeon]
MEKTEGVALVLVLLVMIGLPLAAYNYQTWKLASPPLEGVEIQAWTTENGGWGPHRIVVQEGEAVTLVLRSMDITHSLVIPDLEVDSGPMKPGKPISMELPGLAPGIYSFYCGIWCSAAHGEMKGTLIVVGASA